MVVLALGFDEIGAMILPFVPLAVAGAALCTAQGRVLRRWIPNARGWVAASVAGWAAGALLAVVVGRGVATMEDAVLRPRAGESWYLHQDDSVGISLGLWAGGAAQGSWGCSPSPSWAGCSSGR